MDNKIMIREIERFFEQSNLSASTIETYNYYLRSLALWAESQGIACSDLTPDLFYRWLREHEHWSASCRSLATNAAKTFYRFSCGEDHPMTRIRARRPVSAPQRTLNLDQVSRLLWSLDTSTPKGIRNLALICLMLDTGLRASEICRLELKHLDIPSLSLNCLVKGGHWSERVFCGYSASCLVGWLPLRNEIAKPGVKTVFISVGSPKMGNPLTRTGLRTIFRELGKNAGLGLISPHDLRRTFATMATRAGAPSRIVQIQGDWSSPEMLARYTRALRPEDFAKYSPVLQVMGLL